MAKLFFITHPEVAIDPGRPVTRWHLSEAGIARMRAFANRAIISEVTAIWSSRETKAIEAAGILGGALGLGTSTCRELGENDRSATGYLPADAFELAADAFFAKPESSFDGWERAVDAQSRVLAAVTSISGGHRGGDLAIVSHGAVGTLLYCALSRLPVDRRFDQPFQGCFWQAALPRLRPEAGWSPIAPRA